MSNDGVTVDVPTDEGNEPVCPLSVAQPTSKYGHQTYGGALGIHYLVLPLGNPD